MVEIGLSKSQIRNNLQNFYQNINNYTTVNAGINLGIFEYISKDFKTTKEIKEAFGFKIKERNLLDILDLLYCNKHLLREGVGESAKYKLAHSFFLESNPDNLISLIRINYRLNKRIWNEFEGMIINGEMPKRDYFKEIYSNPEDAYSFLNAMCQYQNETFDELLKTFDFSKFKTLLDVGGCLGHLGSKAKKVFPHLRCVNFDLPLVEPYFEKYQEEKGTKGKVEFLGGDFCKAKDFSEIKPDLIAFGNILHDWGLDEKLDLLKKAYNSLPEGGVLLIIEILVIETRDKLEHGLGMSYLMCLELMNGYNMTKKELESYSKVTGFKEIKFYENKLNHYALLFK